MYSSVFDMICVIRKRIKENGIFGTVLEMKVFVEVHKEIEEYSKCESTREHAKLYRLELEYERKVNKDSLLVAIRDTLGGEPDGQYSHEEIAKVLGIGAEAVRLIERRVAGMYDNRLKKRVGGILTHVSTVRKLRHFVYKNENGE